MRMMFMFLQMEVTRLIIRNMMKRLKEILKDRVMVNAVSAPVNAVEPNSTNNNPSKYPDDPDMPELEDIVYSDDEEDVGAEADLSNLETNIPISPIPTTRVHKDNPINQIISEVNSAPHTKSMTRMVKEQGRLHQIIDEDFHTFMFACFLSQEEPKKVHQALKYPSWIKAMQEELLQFKLQKVWVMVDLPKGKRAIEEGIDYDEVFAPVARIKAIRLFLAYASFMDFMVYQMDVKSDFLYETIKEEVYVCQPLGFADLDYPNKVYKVVKALYGLHQLQKLDVKSASIPIETKKPLPKEPDGEDVDVHVYRCLKGKPHLGSWYPTDSPFNLVAYSDSDYAAASLDRKSIIGGCQFLGCRLISWQCKKHTVVATSLTEVEYVAAVVLKFYGFKISCWTMDTIQYALVVNPTIYVACIKQFWATATIKKINDVVQLRALIDGKKCVSAKRTAWNEFSCSMASVVICLATGRKFNFSKYIFDSMVQNVDSPSKFLMCSGGCIQIGGKIEAIDADEDITLVDVETQEEVVAMDVEPQGRINQEEVNATSKEYDDKEEDIDWNVLAEQIQERHLDNIKKYQSLKKKPVSIAEARKNMIIYLKNMAGYKIKHFRGMNYDKVRPIFEREYKKLKAVEVLGSESTQEIPSNDMKEMYEEDVQNIEDLVTLWNLVKEKFSSTVPSEDKEKALWFELKRVQRALFTSFLEAKSSKLGATPIVVKSRFSVANTIKETNKTKWKVNQNSIINGPYFRRMIPELAVDSYETALQIWLRVQQMMKGSDIGIQKKKAKLVNEWERSRQTDADGWRNRVIQNAVQNLRIQNVGNQNEQIAVLGNANRNSNRNGNLVAARAEGNATRHNINQIRCYNCRGVGHFARNYTVRPRRRDAAYLQTQLLIAQKEEAGIQLQAEESYLMATVVDLDEIEEVNANCILKANLQQASTSGTQTDKSPVYDSNGSAEVHNYENCYDSEIFNMFTQEE
nr:hypothetical protein [Tanacetum cinerariifolium]